MERCAAKLARACPFQIIRLLLVAPHPCPRRPSPDTASTNLRASSGARRTTRRGLNGGCGRSRRLARRCQALIPHPSVNHPPRTRQSLHRGLPLRFYFGTNRPSFLTFHHYTVHEYGRGAAGLFPALAIVAGEPLNIRRCLQSWLASCTKAKSPPDPCRCSPGLGRISIILRVASPTKKKKGTDFGREEGKRLCAECGSHAKGGGGQPRPAGPTPTHHKESCIRIRT